MKKYILNSLILFIPCILFSQVTFRGMIMDRNNSKANLGVDGASVHWLNTNVGAVTNAKGWFAISYKTEYKKLVISYLGYKTDTVTIRNLEPLHHFITPQSELEEITIKSKRNAVQKSTFSTVNMFTVNSEELLKAACCNLAESFETNPSIDVSFSDALTGTRQIQMLGLTSPYLLITQENIPSVRGASQVFGMTFTPGTWVESIQISKGAGSVVNGFESISGQINAELVKPFSDNKFFLNTYSSLNGRLELNTHFNQRVSKKWQTGLYIHGNYRGQKFDKNDDNFIDMPLANQINVMNRWQFTDAEKGWVSFINVRFLNDEKQTGEIEFNPLIDKGTANNWGSEIDTRRFDTSAKLGYVFPELPFQSIGFQMAYSNHQQDSYFGLNAYDIQHQSVYSNLIFNSIIGDTRNKFKTGLSFTYDKFDELVNTSNFNRNENSLGAFFEYAFDNLDNFSVTGGLRIDTHNLLGIFLTPRLHVRYVPWEKGVFRASVGRGKRSANIFAENQQLFASSRQINIDDVGGNIYGLNPEIAWNYGVSYMQKFNLFGKKGDITFDFYQTNFQNQVIVDWENPQEIAFYDLDGRSIANSFQVEASYNLAKNFNLRTAYKYFDITTDYRRGNLQKPMQPQNRFFANLSYETELENEKQWRFDATFNIIGKQRLPNTSINPVQYQLPESIDSYQLLNSQITRVFSNRFELYLGGENLTNVQQKNPILASDDPFGSNFDTTIVYAPIFGRTFYAGLRFKIK
ncbi:MULTISPECIES: carboxypeptidase-like regulatory domain-containing protein [unclassified Polaribacter]|jgi:outer membrane receptor for ferrienterochelin and colicins|uniref:TonB-dependent receptor n=1 Tax=unclassified Polaribacter TaxID=196858 RepID=UPI00056A8EFE|nr:MULTISPECIES: carboxypeptidase-like regulatory domain-containing protein [unclassified Polaribacter]PKV63924.1 outer membrane receptor protein involved in Fe transport [Polaribacter sp. Hel1_33_96]